MSSLALGHNISLKTQARNQLKKELPGYIECIWQGARSIQWGSQTGLSLVNGGEIAILSRVRLKPRADFTF